MNKQKLQTKDFVYMALATALITICSWISIPWAVPFTLQTFAVFAILEMLGGKRGTISIIIYVLLGAVGVPVFAGFKGGIGALLGTTGGYILGFILSGILYLLMEKIIRGRAWLSFLAILLGLIVCYFFGTLWFLVVYTRTKGPVAVLTALTWCVFPFVIPDLVKLVLAFFVGRKMKVHIDRM